MSSKIYRLLRNNKEQGPFTSDELIQKGLKPYDLIWIDGRSTAWSYPSELPEFKLYVPASEEQFDDGSKKQESASSVSPSVQAALAVNDIIIHPATKQPKPRYKVTAAWSRIQTITVPLFREKMVPETTSAKISGTSTFESRPLSWEDAWRDWEKEKNQVELKASPTFLPQSLPAYQQTINQVFGNAPAPETKYSQPPDSPKDRYIENIPQQKKRSGQGFSLGKVSEFIVPSIALFVILSIGYWLLHDDNKTASALSSDPLQTAQPAASSPVNELPANLNTAATNADKTNSVATDKEAEQKTVADEAVTVSKTKQQKVNDVETVKSNNLAEKKAASSKQLSNKKVVTASNSSGTSVKKAANTNTDNIPKDNSYDDQPSGNTGDLTASENKPVRQRTNSDQTTSKQSNLNDQAPTNQGTVSKRSSGKANMKYVNVPQYVEMNDGSGSVKIENVSDVDLDLVVVDVQYYDASSRFRKGETLYLHHLKAGKTVVVKTPRDVNSMYAVSKVSLVSSDANGVYIVSDN